MSRFTTNAMIVFTLVTSACTGAHKADTERRGSTNPQASVSFSPNEISQPVKFPEFSLRDLAEARPLPEYPSASVARHSEGVAVAMVHIEPGGAVRAADILQAPDPYIASSVKTTVEMWHFRPVTLVGSEVPRALISRLTFYFRIVNGKGVVSDPPPTTFTQS